MLQRVKAKKPPTPLQALKLSQLGVRVKAKRKKPALTPLPTLVKKADEAFSRYVRLRDSEYIGGKWVGECITCQRKLVVVDASGKWNAAANLGHYISRGRKVLRWDEYNCNLQCAHCNAWRDKVDMLARYRKGLDAKYGPHTASELEAQGLMEHKPTRQELEQVITDSKEYVAFTLDHPTGL